MASSTAMSSVDVASSSPSIPSKQIELVDGSKVDLPTGWLTSNVQLAGQKQAVISADPLSSAFVEVPKNAVTMFVSRLLPGTGEDHVMAIFERFGKIYGVTMRPPGQLPGFKQASALVTFYSKDSGLAAKLHFQLHPLVLPGMVHPLLVDVARFEGIEPSSKVFVSWTNQAVDAATLETIFKPFGEIEACLVRVPRHDAAERRSIIQFKSPEDAKNAVRCLRHRSAVHLRGLQLQAIRYAEPRDEKVLHEWSVEQQQAVDRRVKELTEQLHDFLPLPLPSFVPDAGLSQSHPGLGQVAATVVPKDVIQTSHLERHDVSQVIYETYASGYSYYDHGGSTASHSYPKAQSYGKYSIGDGAYKARGPKGANLFVFHIPRDIRTTSLCQMFSPFGKVVSARVVVQRETGESRGYGFVSYDNPYSAQAAIFAMNGAQYGSKRLLVQLKNE